MIKPQPQLDPIRLELAAGLYESVVWQLEVYCDDAKRFSLLPEDAARLQSIADLVGWQAEEYRRCAMKIRADDEMVAARFAGLPVVPNTVAAFEASISRLPHPRLPEPSSTIDYEMLAPARQLLEEAHAVLSRGGSSTVTEHAATQARILYTWCHPPVDWQ